MDQQIIIENKDVYLDEKVLSMIRSDFKKLASMSLNSRGQHKKFREKYWKWLALFMISVLMMSNQFCEDNPATIQTTLEDQLGISQFKYSLLYAVYAYPNIVFPIFGGVFLDRIGVRIGMMTFCLIAFVGQLVFSVGGYRESYNIMIWGRFIFGMGGENLSLSMTYLTCKWFDEKLLSLAFGMSTSLAYLATAMNGIVLPLIYNEDNTDSLGDALFIGVCLVLCGLICAILMSILDLIADKIDGEGKYKIHHFEWKNITNFSRTYWIFCLLVFTTFSAQLPFIQVSSKYLQIEYGFDEIWSGRIYAIPYLLTATTCPLLGLYIDKNGHRLYFCNYLIPNSFLDITSSVFLVAGHMVNLLLPECEEACYIAILPITLIGISFALFQASIWGIIPDLVNPQQSGSALGFAYSCQCIAIAAIPSIGAIIHDKTINIMNGFYWQTMFWLIFAILSTVSSVLLFIEDGYVFKGRLNKSYKQREQDKLNEEIQLLNDSKHDYNAFNQYSYDENPVDDSLTMRLQKRTFSKNEHIITNTEQSQQD